MSALCSFAGGVPDCFAGAGDEGFVGGMTDSEPFIGSEPKDFTESKVLTAGVAAGDEEIGAETLSIDPKVTEEAGWVDKKRDDNENQRHTLLHRANIVPGDAYTIFYGHTSDCGTRTTRMSWSWRL